MNNLKMTIPSEWNLKEEQLHKIYEVEREQSDRLRKEVNPDKRRKLYSDVYEKYFSQLPFHPQFTIKQTDEIKSKRVDYQLNKIKHLVAEDNVFIEIGAGDCSLSLKLSNYCKKIYCLEVSDEIVNNIKFPSNVECIIFDGFNIPLEDDSVDVAYSNQLMEHLHPEDAKEQLKSILKVLKKNGLYICITPNRLVGPNDISRFYTEDLVGFHLKEYSSTDLKNLYLNVNFSSVFAYVSIKNKSYRVPFVLISLLEKTISFFPKRIRRKIVQFKLFSILFNSLIVAKK